MGLKKKWTRTNLRQYFSGYGLKFELVKFPKSITKIYRDNIQIIEINDYNISFIGDVIINIPIGLIDTFKLKENFPYLIFRVFLLKEQYLEFELKLLNEKDNIKKDKRIK